MKNTDTLNRSPMLFLRTALSNMTQVGAVLPSSSFLVNKMLSCADFKKARYVVEYGTGTGVLSKAILTRCKPESSLIGLELNTRFHNFLSRHISDRRFHLYNENALNLGKCLCRHDISEVDYIFSCIPFTLFTASDRRNILEETRRCLNHDGKFVMFQYSRSMEKLLREIFDDVKVHFVMRNIPPAFVFVCSKKNANC